MPGDIDAFLSLVKNISGEESLDSFLRQVLSEAVRFANADYAVWAQKEAPSGTAFRYSFEFSAHLDLPAPPLPGTIDPGEDGFLAQVLDCGSLRILDDYQTHPHALSALVRFGIGKVLGIPVRGEGPVQGVLLLCFFCKDHEIDAKELRFFEFLAQQMEILLGRRAALEESRTIKNQFLSVSRLYKALTSLNALILERPEEQHLLSETIRILIELGGFIGVGFYFPEPLNRRLDLKIYKITDNTGDLSRYPLSFSLEPESHDVRTSLAVRCFLTQTPVVDNDLLRHYQTVGAITRLENYKVLSFRSTAVFPIFRGGSCSSVFAFVSKDKDFFTPDILNLLSETARILSMTLDIIDTERERRESEERLATLIEHLPEAIFFKDGMGRWKTVNPAALRLFHLEDRSDWIGKTDRELALDHPEFAHTYQACIASDEAAWEGKETVTGIEVFPGRGRPQTILEISKIPLFNQDGSRKGLVVSGQDITQKRRDEEIRERYVRIFENTSEGILITGTDQKIIDVNLAFSQITEFEREEVLDKTPAILKSGVHKSDFFQTMWKKIEEDGRWEGEIWNRKKSGSLYCEWLSIIALREGNQVTHYIGIFSDISDRKSSEQKIEYLATHDTLTDLPNRRVFKERVEMYLQQDGRTEEAFILGILDLDGFKSVNDRLGHQAGDELLSQVARRLKAALRKSDTLARLGGDEFGVLLSVSEGEISYLALDKIMKIFQKPFVLNQAKKETVTISGSLGLTICPPDKGPFESLLAHADLALYRVKEGGRNGWALFERNMEDALNEQHRIRQDFSQAVVNEELLLCYQPQANMKTGQIEGVEALVRWNHPKKGLLQPLSFIDVIEKSDMIHHLGRWVLSQAMAQQKEWKKIGLHLRISVNIGAKHFLSDDFIPFLKTSLAPLPSGKPEAELSLEITETEALHDLKKARFVIDQCRALGVRVSLDDFGTGQASVKALQELSIDEVKIDRGFVGKIGKNPKSLAIVSSLISAARMLMINVVAEGIENEEEGQVLIHMGCPVAQGSAISPPLLPDELPGWISAWEPSLSWQNVFSYEMTRIEELSCLMISHSSKTFLKDSLSDLNRPDSSGERWKGTPSCSACQWITHAIRICDIGTNLDLNGARDLHESLHRLVTQAFDARDRQDNAEFDRLREELVKKGEASQRNFQKLLKVSGR